MHKDQSNFNRMGSSSFLKSFDGEVKQNKEINVEPHTSLPPTTQKLIYELAEV